MNEASNTSRRGFLRRTLVAGVLAQGAAPARAATGPVPQSPGSSGPQASIIDTNVYLDPWPFRRLRLADPEALAAKCRQLGIGEAWAGTLDGLFHRDVASANAHLAEACARQPVFRPMGTINPTLPRWQDDLWRCAHKHGMRGIRLHPNYHGYKLDDARFTELLKLAAAEKLIVQIAAIMEDERTQYPLVQVPPVDVGPLPVALEAAPDARVMLLNWSRVTAGKPVAQFLKGAKVLLDIAMLEGIAGIEELLAELPAERLVFGSYAPVFNPEAAKLKLRESALSEAQVEAITRGNAVQFLA